MRRHTTPISERNGSEKKRRREKSAVSDRRRGRSGSRDGCPQIQAVDKGSRHKSRHRPVSERLARLPERLLKLVGIPVADRRGRAARSGRETERQIAGSTSSFVASRAAAGAHRACHRARIEHDGKPDIEQGKRQHQEKQRCPVCKETSHYPVKRCR
jgi:hypothetical protein